jgi:hypothetical protein
LLLGASPRLAGASRLVVTPSFDVIVQRSSETVDRQQRLQLDVTIASHADADDVGLQIVAFSAAPLDNRHFPIKVQTDDLHHYTAVATFPDRGTWQLRFTVTQQSGSPEIGFLPVTVTDPDAMAPSLAWLIGFSPLAALGLFALSEAARTQTGRAP